ncbi:hypothetical protein RSOLAG1IB_10993 [Rhizoctonia solani AG-1 IB]|uniref:Uncharacterized protein n=1 Tax=Thanatephorus cucumeris (strain AG1-IB / isolate 7/3/14) TaxID=1108050 RepID=A0A0B7G222_THACB|nr:hypothetical protein RSOLAG1IB_10993 [Rhizoctonia solani AG-1 IB]
MKAPSFPTNTGIAHEQENRGVQAWQERKRERSYPVDYERDGSKRWGGDKKHSGRLKFRTGPVQKEMLGIQGQKRRRWTDKLGSRAHLKFCQVLHRRNEFCRPSEIDLSVTSRNILSWILLVEEAFRKFTN